MNKETVINILYLLEAWERGADADDYAMDLWHLRQLLDMSTKSQNVDTSAERVQESHKSIHEEIEKQKAEINRLKDLAGYRLKLLVQMPENKPEQAHTDHPMRHLDRTCPACLAEPWDTSDMAYRPNGLSVEQSIAQPEQDAVAWMWKDGTITTDPDYADGTWTPLFTAPPSKPWVDLTNDEAAECWTTSAIMTWKRIQDKLRGKNT